MRGDRVFLDTNIIVYAYDISDKDKHVKAVEIIEGLWKSGIGIISTQVLQEFFVNVTGKIPSPLDVTSAKSIIKDLLTWDVVVNDGGSILNALDIHQRLKFSFWDSMILGAAIKGGAEVLLTEDFSNGQVFDGVTIRNPFLNIL